MPRWGRRLTLAVYLGVALAACNGGEDPADAGPDAVDSGPPPTDADEPITDADTPSSDAEGEPGDAEDLDGDDDGFPDTGDGDRVTILWPEEGGSYADQAPMLIFSIDPELEDGDPMPEVRIGGHDISDTVILDETTGNALGLETLMDEGENTITVSLGSETETVTFDWDPCSTDDCESEPPEILAVGSPDTPLTALRQTTIFGENLGTAGDLRILIINGERFEIGPLHTAENHLPFVPPLGIDAIRLQVEVNGVVSNTWTTEVVAP